MLLVRDLAALPTGSPSVLTIGTFDGVHRGHQWLIHEVIERAAALSCQSVVVTFDPAPQILLRPGSRQLTGGIEKATLIEALGPDVLAVIPFTEAFSRMPAAGFLETLVERLHVAEIWTGADFVFGHNRGGNVDLLIQGGAEHHFAVHVVPRQADTKTAISSSRIRSLIQDGDIRAAGALMGHYPSLRGPVVRGFGRGAELGFPTANVLPEVAQLLPANGVYAGFLRIDGAALPAAISVGFNVVFGGQDIVVEAYVLDFTGDLREKTVVLDFVDRVSDEEELDSVEALIVKIQRDVDRTREILAAEP